MYRSPMFFRSVFSRDDSDDEDKGGGALTEDDVRAQRTTADALGHPGKYLKHLRNWRT